MAPTIVYDAAGRVCMVVGSPGGSAIINYVAKAIVGGDRLGARSAGGGRAAQLRQPQRARPSSSTDTPVAALAPKLRALGHDVSVMPLTSGAGAILRERGTWVGGADPRREGTVRGE